jgi:D-alanine-D-alanine ligase
LPEAIAEAFAYDNKVLVEEFIRGRELSCGVVENFRGQDVYALLPVEIRTPTGKSFYDYEAKYSHPDTRIESAPISTEEKELVMAAAREAHKSIGAKHYSRSDFVISPTRGLHIIEINTLPGLTPHSIMPNSLEQIGCSRPQFLDHVISLALGKS